MNSGTLKTVWKIEAGGASVLASRDNFKTAREDARPTKKEIWLNAK